MKGARMMKMKAMGFYEFGEPSVLKEIELQMPEAGDDQVLIRVGGTSVNFADIQTRKGSFHGGGADFPVVPGLDAAGTVEAVGRNVRDIREGDRVIAFPRTGTYSEYIVADRALTYVIPDEISMVQAAASPLVSFTSHMLLNKVAELEKGETIVIHAAAGGIGTTVIQIARAMGAGRIIGTVRGEEKRQKALEAGADYVIRSERDNFAEEIMKLTDGRGADVILDSIGGEFTSMSMDCLAMYGRLVVFGNASGSYGMIDTKLLHSSTRSVRGFSSVTTRNNRPQWFKDTAGEVIRLMAEKKIDMKVSHVMKLSDAAKAHELMESGGVTGKIVLEV